MTAPAARQNPKAGMRTEQRALLKTVSAEQPALNFSELLSIARPPRREQAACFKEFREAHPSRWQPLLQQQWETEKVLSAYLTLKHVPSSAGSSELIWNVLQCLLLQRISQNGSL
ncbi:unnamed protein product [Heligmosomoides polygyrus]|uniref:SCAN box domain-containing protein n=1 Tax=Heligmosomoides polygyrus TaxID=6339 RepID=A0A183FH14_HELPZ|nr:unnamed protein product [Heligmosomoides polygyrus]